MGQDFLAIVNPAAGYRDRLCRVRGVGRLLGLGGDTLKIELTVSRGHAKVLAASAPDGVQAVLVAGGDGTVGEVFNGLAGRQLPIAILRTGTENLLARELGMPTGLDRLVALLRGGDAVPIDVGEANGHRFIAVAGLGFDAECVARMSRIRRGHITHLDYFWPIWDTFWSYPFPEIVVEADGEVVFDGRGFALIGNIARYSVGMRVLSRAKFDDGLLDLAVFPCGSKPQMVGHGLRALSNRLRPSPTFMYRQVRTVRASSPERVPIELDGEPAGFLPFECKVLPGAARYLRAPQSIPERGT